MTKQEFLARLEKGLKGLPKDDVDERLNFYDEMIDDSIEEGMTEDEAVDKIGSPEDVAAWIIDDTPLVKLVREKVKPKKELTTWQIVLLILGFPVWFPLLISGLACVFALYVSLWAAVASVWACELAFALTGVCGIPVGILQISVGRETPGAICISSAFICAGLALILFFGCTGATRGTVLIGKRITSWIKSCIVGKENK